MILRDAGYLVIRVTYRQFTERPLVVIAHVARMLDRGQRARGSGTAAMEGSSPGSGTVAPEGPH